MATTKKAGDAGQAAALPDETTRQAGPMFKPFEWVEIDGFKDLPAEPMIRFVGSVRDVSAGCAVIMQLVEREEIDASCADEDGNDLPRLLPSTASGDLLRLAIASMKLLEQSAIHLVDWAEEHHKKPGQAG